MMKQSQTKRVVDITVIDVAIRLVPWAKKMISITKPPSKILKKKTF